MKVIVPGGPIKESVEDNANAAGPESPNSFIEAALKSPEYRSIALPFLQWLITLSWS